MTLLCTFYQIQALNYYLEKLLKNSKTFHIPSVVKRTAIIHDKLCDVVEAISAFYLPNIFTFFLGFWYFSMFAVYNTYLLIKFPSHQLEYFLRTSILWLLYYSPCVLWMITFSSCISKEGYRTANLIQHLTVLKTDRRSLAKTNILMQQMSHRIPQISCGMFELNWKFFFACLGGTFNFSIILIQFCDVTN